MKRRTPQLPPRLTQGNARALARLAWLAWALAAVLPMPLWAAGTTVAVGGALRDDNVAVWGRLVELAGGRGARYVVLATASSDPEAAAAAIVANLQRHGAVATVLPVAPRLPGIAVQAAVRDPRWIAEVAQASGVFFSGGDQARLVDTLQPGGRATPLLQAIRALFDRGGVVAGTSAGAAVLSALMFRDVPDVLAAMQQPLRDDVEIDRGFGFLPAGVFVDQHFLRRGRIGRMLPLMVARGITLGLGVDEDSAAVVQGTQVEVLGAAVLVVDLGDARHDVQQGAFKLQGARLHLLGGGDGYDLALRRVHGGMPARKEGGTAACEAPALEIDMLGPGKLAALMSRLAHSGATEALGLAFSTRATTGDAPPAPAFEWRLAKTPETRSWGGSDCRGGSVAGLLLDLRPVRMAQPLYRPMRATP